ncbi:hypothetical protein XI09_26340 [Bradyrhizobium sp. CCBAU 11386]|nr:hypothetical protein [Bradyrhizobium sp. CCBAU 11386]
MLFDTLNELFAIQFIMMPNPEAEARQKARWEGRDLTNVRMGGPSIGKHAMGRAKPKILEDFGAKLALFLGDDVDHLLFGMNASRLPEQADIATEPAANPEPLVPVPPVLVHEQDKPKGKKTSSRKAAETHSHLHVVQVKRRA